MVHAKVLLIASFIQTKYWHHFISKLWVNLDILKLKSYHRLKNKLAQKLAH